MIELAADLRIAGARAAFEVLAKAAAGQPIELAAGAVTRIDAAGLQAIAAAIVQWRTAGISWRWDNPSAAFRDASRLSGLDTHFELK